MATKRGITLTCAQLEQRGKIIKGLLVANEVRGSHSTGVGIVRGSNCRIIKEVGGAQEFVKRTRVKDLLKSKYDILIGHTRLATHGGISKANAHPFREGSILGAHNGIISNYRELDPISSVDSQALLRNLDQNKNDFQKVFSNISGSCTLTWYDFNNPEFLYVVAHYNPISLALVPEFESIFWSSEKNALEVVLSSTTNFYTPIPCDYDQVYKININTLDVTREDVEFSKNYYSRRLNVEDWYGFKHGLTENIASRLKKEKVTKQARTKDKEEEWEIDRDSLEFANVVDDVYKQAFNGCVQCGTKTEYECWYDYEEDRVLCRECMEKQGFPEELIRIDLLNDYYHAQEILGNRPQEEESIMEGQVM